MSTNKTNGSVINKILGDNELKTTFGTNGKERALAEFTSDKMVKSTYELYEELLKNR